MATLVAQDVFAKDVLEAVHNFTTGHVFKLALSNTAIASSVTSLAGITEIANGGGYTTGGITLTATTSAPSTGQGAFAFADVTLTASSSIATYRYGLIYNSSVSNRAVASLDLGSAVTLTSGGIASQTFDFAATALTLL